LRNCLGLVLIAALIPVDALARRYIKGSVGAFGRKWILGDTTVAACALVALLLFLLPMAKGDKQLEAQFAAEQLRLGPGPVNNEAIASQLRAGCTLFTISKYPFTVVAWQPYWAQFHTFYYSLPIGDDSSFNDVTRKYGVDLQRDFENVQGCVAVFFIPSVEPASALAFLQDYFQRRHLRKVAETPNGWELWSSNQQER
jgi:hypothetical protein